MRAALLVSIAMLSSLTLPIPVYSQCQRSFRHPDHLRDDSLPIHLRHMLIDAEDTEREARKTADAEAARAAAEKAKQDLEAESSLNLSREDRKRVQLALILLGYNTCDTEGVFGPRTREMI